MNEGSSDRLDALPAGTELQGYAIESVLGHGGFGIVYQARHHELGTVVAIKEYMPAELSVRRNSSVEPRSESCSELYEDGLRRFLDEARQLVRFQNHPCVVSCQDLFRGNGTAYLVMERVDGLPLSELLRLREKTGQPFTEEELLRVILPLLEGLAAVHAEGVLHRDIKPANILIRRSNEQPVLIDFGAAKQVVANQSRSLAPYTEGYAAIEQIGAGELGPWTDIYGLGAVMWRIVAGGNPPWEHADWKDRNWSPPNPLKVETRVQARAFHSPDPLPSAGDVGAGRYSSHVLHAIDRCLRLAEEDRVKHCKELISLLKRERRTSTAGTTPPRHTGVSQGEAPRVVRPPSGLPSLAKPVAAVVAALLAAGVAAVFLTGFDSFSEGENLGEATPGPFTVEPVPTDAQVRVPDLDQPYEAGMELAPGEYWVEVSAEGFKTRRERLKHDGAGSLHRVELERLTSGFRVVTVPTWASVRFVLRKEAYIPGMLLGHGSYTVEVRAPGYTPTRRLVKHDGRNVPRIELELVRASFTVDTVPSGAKTRMLDRAITYRPGMELPSGEYRVEVSAPGYETKVEPIRHGTSPTHVRVELQPKVIPLQDVEVVRPRLIRKAEPSHTSISSSLTGNSPEPPRLIRKVEPSYTDEAKEANLEGTVTLQIEIWEDGRPHQVRVVRSLGMGLDEKAIEAARQWRFTPGTKDGKPIRVTAQIEFLFRLR